MIEGPCSGKADADSASTADVVALTATVAGNTAATSTKADGSALTAAERVLSRRDCWLHGLDWQFRTLFLHEDADGRSIVS